jgi:hypothetical protein
MPTDPRGFLGRQPGLYCHRLEDARYITRANPGEAHQRRAAARLGARWLELDTGHYPMPSMPDALTQMLVDAGRPCRSKMLVDSYHVSRLT